MVLKIIFLGSFLFYFNPETASASAEVGIVLDCYGRCEQETKQYNRRLSFGRPVKLKETLKTSKNSSLWLFLYEGSLLRLAPDSLIEIKELKVNFNEKSSHLAIEVHRGHVFALPRTREIKSIEIDSFRELFPLFEVEANAFWDLYLFNETQKDIILDMKSDKFIEFRLKNLQNFLNKNNEVFSITEQYYTIHSPNFIIQSKSRPIDFIYLIGDGAIVGSRNDFKGIKFPSNKMKSYLPMIQYKEVDMKNGNWYKVLKKEAKIHTNDLGIIEYKIYMKSFSTFLKAREIFIEKFIKKMKGMNQTFAAKSLQDHYLAEVQRKPFNFKASVEEATGAKSLMSLFNQYFIGLNRTEGPKLKEASLVNIFQTMNRQKRSWLLKKELKDVGEQNRKILIDFGKSKSKKKRTF